MRTLTIPYALAERLADLHLLEPYPPAAYEELRSLMAQDAPTVLEVLPRLKTPYYTIGPTEPRLPGLYKVSGTCLVFLAESDAQDCADRMNEQRARAMATSLERRVLQIEGTVDSMYTSWLIDSLGESVQVGGAYTTPWEAADWCERNGFAWEVVGLADDVDPVAVLKGWRAAR
jgi:hypothetical protein